MQRAEMEELRQRDANLTALQAIGPRKKPRLDGDSTTTSMVSFYIKKKWKINKLNKKIFIFVCRQAIQVQAQEVHQHHPDLE